MVARVKIDVVQQVARDRGGILLSSEYRNNSTPLKWECKEGHTWEATFHHVKSSRSWCPTCSNRVPATLEVAQEVAAVKGGKCLRVFSKDKAVVGVWECHLEHQWEAGVSTVRKVSWCPTCAGKRLTLEGMQERAKMHGGKCLSPLYKPGVKLEWECKEGHTFWKIPAVDGWCPTCAGRRRTGQDLQEVAKSHGGVCLDNDWIHVDYKYLWQCDKGHEWSALFHNVKGKDSWCPYCKQFKTERLCREVFERLWGTPFPKSRPPWLRNSRGNQMELDGFSETLKVAFEFQGVQHYKDFAHIWERDFSWSQERDQQKRDLCKANGVHLIEIPYFEDVVPFIERVFQCSAPS